MILLKHFQKEGLKIIDGNSPETFNYFYKSIIPFKICEQCEEYWTTFHVKYCSDCYFKLLKKFEVKNSRRKLVVK